MKLFRSSVSILTVAAFMSAMAVSSSQARGYRYGGGGGGGGAALGAGLALGILGAAIAAQRAQQGGYYGRPRYYVPRRRYARRPPPPPPKVEPTKVAENTPTTIQFFWNCYSPHATDTVSAQAEHGFIKERWSSRMVCGRRDYPVKEFEYVSPKDYVGLDKVVYTERGRLRQVEVLDVGDYNKPFEPSPEYQVYGTQEARLINETGCEPAKMEPQAEKGFASIRTDETADASCPHGVKFKQTLVYRAPDSYFGDDEIRLFSANEAPMTFHINVMSEKPQANEPEVPDTPAPPNAAPSTTPSAAETPAPTQTPAAALSASVAKPDATPDKAASPAPEKASASTDDKSKDADADALAKELSK